MTPTRPGRDHVETKRIGIAPSVAVGLGSSTRAILSYICLRSGQCPRLRHPVRSRDQHRRWPNFATSRRRSITTIITACSSAIDEKLRTNIVTFALEHDLTDDIRVANTTRYGHAMRDSIYSSPRFRQHDAAP